MSRLPDAARMSALVTVARVSTAVLTLSQLAQAGDDQALAQLEAMAALLPDVRG